MSKQQSRYTTEQQIEDISRAQIDEFFIRHQWIPNPIKRDVGEDIVVRIYDNERWSGLSFYVQLKGTSDLTKYSLKTEKFVSYSVEVKDIKHWEDATLPVIFIVWDIEKRIGIWENIANVILHLEEDNPFWREQTTVNIKLSTHNTMEDSGLKNLRYRIADYSYPLVSQKKSLDMNVSLHIPNTQEGQKFIEDLQKFQAKGGEITIPPEFIAELTTSEWHQRLYGEVVFSKEHPMFVSSREADTSTPSRIDIFSSDSRSASLPYVDLKNIQSGFEEAIISNRHQNIPLHFHWIINFKDQSTQLSLNMIDAGMNVQDTLDSLKFLKIWNTPGSRIYFMPLNGQQPLIFDSPLVTELPGINDEFEAIVEKLCYIQRKTGTRLALKELQLDENSILRIDEVFSVMTTGKMELNNVDVKPEFKRPIVEKALEAIKSGMAFTYSTMAAESRSIILDTEIVLGLGNWKFVARPRLDEAELVKILDEMQPDDIREIPVTIIKGSAEFSDWIPKSN
jgi:hypothetical protein